ncbi:MAG: hypothetical protein MJY71_07455 [Bacteroidaceae bacterium]|nr:hypothetical protein [Bacteroidaceae bacterium]
MKKYSLVHIYAVLLVFVGMLSFSQPALCNRIEEQLEKSDRLIEEDKPQSAAMVLESVLSSKKAKPVERLEAAVKLAQVYKTYKEDCDKATLDIFRGLENKLSGPYLAVDYALIANFYSNCLNNNRRLTEFANNNGTLEEPGTDYTKWSRQTLQDTIWYYQLKSVETAQNACQKTDVKVFEDILQDYSTVIGDVWLDDAQKHERVNLVKTLHQMLICNAIEHEIIQNWTGNLYGTGAKMLYDKRVCSTAEDFIELCTEYNARTMSSGTLYMLYLLTNQSKGMSSDIRAAVDLYRIKTISEAQEPAFYDSGLRSIAEYYSVQNEPLAAVFYYMQAEQCRESNPNGSDSICNVAIEQFPNSLGASMCVSLRERLRKPMIQASFDKVLYPESDNIGFILTANVGRIYFTLVPVDYNTFRGYIDNAGGIDNLKKISEDKNSGIDWKNAVKWEQKIADKPSFEKRKLYFNIPKNEYKNSLLIIADKPELNENTTAVVCDMISQEYVGVLLNSFESTVPIGVVADMNSGKPASGKKYSFYSTEYSSLLKKRVNKDLYANGFVDKKGFVQIDKPVKPLKSGNYNFSFDDGTYSLDYYFYKNSTETANRNYCDIYTDRKTYRPGDTVQVYAIFERTDQNGKTSLVPRKNLIVELSGNYGKVRQTVECITDEYGACIATFVLPDNVRPDAFSIQVQEPDEKRYCGYCSINVIEYVQPKMTVTLSADQPYYSFGNAITVTGKAASYSGTYLPGARVNYYVDSSVKYYPYYNNDNHRVLTGKTVVGSDGSFRIEFVPVLPDNPLNVNEIQYNIHATVVASDGNSEEQELNILVSKYPFRINILDVYEKSVCNGSFSVHCNLANAQGAIFSDTYQYQLFKLKDQAPKYSYKNEFDYYSQSELSIPVCMENIGELETKFPNYAFLGENDFANWSVESLVCAGDAMSDAFVSVANNLENGVYRLVVQYSKDGMTVTDKMNFVSVSANSTKPVGNRLFTAVLDKSEYLPGETALLTVQSPYKDVTVYCLYANADGVYRKDTIELSQSVRTLPIAVTEKDLDGISISMLAVKEKIEEHTSVKIDFRRGKMNLIIDKFEDKIESGSPSRLTLHVTDAKDKPAKARILLSMNDASLYSFGINNWNLPFSSAEQYGKTRVMNPLFSIEKYRSTWYCEQDIRSKGGLTLKVSALRDYAYFPPVEESEFEGLAVGAIRLKASSVNSAAETKLQGSLEGLDIVEMNDVVEEGIEAVFENSSVIRSNFGNTVLFRALETDKYGCLNVPFTAPDLLTEWNMQILAYNTKLECDIDSKSTKTYRTVMIEALPLQFVTQGDTVLFSARVSNASDHDADAQIYLRLKDEQGNVLESALPEGSIQEVTIPAMGSTGVSFKVAVPLNIQNLDYTFVVKTAWSSDGEHNVLPVRSNVMTLIESAAFYNNGNEKRTFPVNFKNISSGAISSFKLEVTPSAVWCALRALPGLTDKEAVTNLSIFYNLYADMLYYSIFNEYPAIQKEADADSVKLLAAQSGLRRNFDKLRDAVEDDGGWSWIAGRESDVYISLQIMKGFADLQRLGVLKRSLGIITQEELYSLMKNAVKYLDSKMFESYTREIEHKSARTSVGYTEMLYLYARTVWNTVFDIDKKYSKMFDYYLKLALNQKRNSLNLRERALLSLTLSLQNNSKAAKKYAEGLVERALTEDEFGLFWRDNTGCSQIELQSLIIQALSCSGYGNEAELATRWLVKQKQATVWNNAYETAYSIAALLDNGMISVPQEASDVVVSFDGGDIAPITVSGIADVMQDLDIETVGKIRNVSVETTSDQMCWGALYCEYSHTIDNIVPFGQGLAIERTYFIVNESDNGTSLSRVTDLNHVKVGDKVLVRLTVKSDRAADYVELSDMRAAGYVVSDQRPRYEISSGFSYYVAPGKDACRIYINRVKRGESVVEYYLTKMADGQFTVGPATIECTIAPELRASTSGSIK